MRQRAPRRQQRGIALWLLLVALAMAGSYAWYSSSNSSFNRAHQDSQLAIRMARAKDAVIAYAVLDDKRPGRLLCPDMLGDGTSPLLARDNCDANHGGMPWKTLDLEAHDDNHGTPLQLAVYSLFSGDRPNVPLNSDTDPGLTLTAADGANLGDIAGLVIAPRGALDPANADGDNSYRAGRSNADGDNDLILPIGRWELMAAVEKRVANEVKSCLDQHAASAANTAHRTPWPAPFSATDREGKAGSRFGRVPLTEPGSGVDAALSNNIGKLTRALNTLSTAPDASQQMLALQSLGALLLEARNLFDAIFGIANQLKQAADAADTRLQQIDSAIKRAVANARISRSEGGGIRTLVTDTETVLAALPTLLGKLGIDPLPWELERQRNTLLAAGSATPLLDSTRYLEQLLWATSTPRTADILPRLEAARAVATTARIDAENAARAGSDTTLASARASAGTLGDAIKALQLGIEASRVSELASTVALWNAPLGALQANLQAAPDAANLAPLKAALIDTKAFVDSIVTGIPDVIAARAAAASALASLLAASAASPPDYAALATDTGAQLALDNLASAITANEAVNNNVSQTSLAALLAAYQSARTTFVDRDTASSRPRQSDLVPFAQALDDATVDIDLWAKIISANAALIAPQAKAAPTSDTADARILDGSAYKTAADALTGITGKNKTQQLLQAYLDRQNAANLDEAKRALSETVARVNTLLANAAQLDKLLAGTTATASPITWLASRCDFLLTNADSWWNTQQWAGTLFYQVGHPLQAMPGTLSVNGAGAYRRVAIAAGHALPPPLPPPLNPPPPTAQNRAIASVANFFEGGNAHASRDGDATVPAADFTAVPPSANFNDRLAY